MIKSILLKIDFEVETCSFQMDRCIWNSEMKIFEEKLLIGNESLGMVKYSYYCVLVTIENHFVNLYF